MALLLGSLASGRAEAHLPHDVVRGLAVGEDFSTSGAAWALLELDGATGQNGTLLLVSDDFGESWRFGPPLPGASLPLELAVSGGTPWVLYGGDSLVRLVGDVWETVPMPDTSPRHIQGSAEGLLLGSSDGIFLLRSGEVQWEQLVAEGVQRFAGSPETGLVYLTDSPALGWYLGGETSALPDPGPISGLAVVEGVVYGVLRGASVVRWDGGEAWGACGSIEGSRDETKFEYGQSIVEVSASGNTLAVATGQDIFVSRDECASFEEEMPFLDGMTYGGLGYPSDAGEAWAGIVLAGPRLLVGGWRGIATQATPGLAWHRPRLLSGTFVRGIEVSADGSLLAASYGGSVLWTADGGESWEGGTTEVAGGLSYGRDIGLLPGGAWLYLADVEARVSEGGDGRLEQVELGFGTGERVVSGTESTWVLGNQLEGGGLFRADTGWNFAPEDFGVGVGEWAMEQASAGGLLLATSEPARLLLRGDGGWEVIADDGVQTRAALCLEDGRTIRAVETGVLVAESGGSSWVASDGGPSFISHLVEVPGQGILAVDSRGSSWLSEDEGVSWYSWGSSIPPVEDTAWVDGALVVATADGMYWADWERGAWIPMPSLDRVLLGDDSIECVPACRPALVTGDRIAWSTRGRFFEVEGIGDASLRLWVDGSDRGKIGFGDEVDLGTDGVANVMLGLDRGTGSLVALRSLSVGEPLPRASVGSAESCGCDDRGYAAFALVGLASLRRLRGRARCS